MKFLMELRDRGFNGQVVIKGDEQPWEQGRQGRMKYFLNREVDLGTALRQWNVFISDIRKHTGKHRHQGGLIIYVLEGEGYTEVDGVTYEWEAGDLLLLPIKPGGVEHKHYNKQVGQSCKWMAFIYRSYSDELGYYVEQKENHPDYR